MTSTGASFPSDIEKAAESLKLLRPSYVDLLSFYANVFMAQEEVEQYLHLELKQIPDQMLSLKAKEGFPLLQPSEFAIDKAVSTNLFKKICHVA